MRNLMSRLLYFLLLLTIGVSCNSETAAVNNQYTKADSLPVPTDSATLYFPSKDSAKSSLHNDKALDSFMNSWYSRMLFALRQPVLYIRSSDIQVYRLTLLPTFEHPLAIRLQKNGNRIHVLTTITN